MPFLSAIPQALMTAEMSTMMDENGGTVVWTARAFGDFIGWINSYNYVISSCFDNAIYPIIFVEYLGRSLPDLTETEKWFIKFALVLFITAINLVGLEVVSWVSAVLTVAICFPLVIEFGMVATQISPSTQWTLIPEDVDWGLYLSTVLWIYAGWDSLGTIAGEVKNPSVTYPKGILMALILNSAVYLAPIIVGLTVSTDPKKWKAGFFEEIAFGINPILGRTVMVGAVLSNVGVFNAGMVASARTMSAMGEGESQARQLPAIFAYNWKRFNSPAFSVLANGVITCLLISVDFSILVTCDTFLHCVILLVEFAAFLWLKIKEPHAPRPYVVPGGMWGAYLITIPKVAILLVTMVLVSYQTIMLSCGILFLVSLAYGIKAAYVRSRPENHPEVE
eukprot:TRINITY_DN9404_c0_g1_i1.p1 TRINITY_DN9404_c0_g1~~TRINITY_DN9404_c0_g1_i1.p1  ORF type:complete len:393 (+),score=66.08 TRINITY_DN9404_c0_g1_i1:238-1416(+)